MLCRSVEFDLPNSQHMLCLIGRANVGRLNGYHCYCSSTRASTSFYNGIDKLLSPALLKVSCLPVLPTVQPAGSKQRPPVDPVSARICGCTRAHAHLLPARARTRARALVHVPACMRARAPALIAYARARALSLLATKVRHLLPAVTCTCSSTSVQQLPPRCYLLAAKVRCCRTRARIRRSC